jgi:hypothetical protein
MALPKRHTNRRLATAPDSVGGYDNLAEEDIHNPKEKMNESVPVEVAVNPLISILFSVLGLVALVCWIMEIVAAFKKEEKPLMGILSIVLCSLGGFIIGWINSKKWGIQKIMMIWTIVVVVLIIVQVIYGASLAAAMSGGVTP